jgi:hypothetical protein
MRRAACVWLGFFVVGCGNDAITIHATLQAGSASASSAGPPAKLDCTALTSPPLEAVATASADGKVGLSLAARGKPFACVVRDASGTLLASVLFVSASSFGLSMSTSTDTDLGTIVVDAAAGVAQANVPSGVAVTASAGLPCPQGAWTVSLGEAPAPPCAASTQSKLTIFVFGSAGGGLRVNYLQGPLQSPSGVRADQATCGFVAQNELASTYDGKVLSFVTTEGSCKLNVTLTPAADCSSAAMAASVASGGCSAPSGQTLTKE